MPFSAFVETGVYGRVTAYIPEAEQKFGGGLKRVPGCYTDDTEMAIGLALSLVATRGDVDTVHIAEQHARLYSPWRGYGRGTTKVLEALVSGTASPLICGLELTRPSYEPKATWQGSKSNGGAMRIHPLGVLAATVGASPEVVRRATTAALLPTHTHPEAIDAAFCQALAVARLCRECLRQRVQLLDPSRRARCAACRGGRTRSRAGSGGYC